MFLDKLFLGPLRKKKKITPWSFSRHVCNTLEYSSWWESTVVRNFFCHCERSALSSLNSPFSLLFIRSIFVFFLVDVLAHRGSMWVAQTALRSWADLLGPGDIWKLCEGNRDCCWVQQAVNVCLLTTSTSSEGKSLSKIRGKGAVMCFLFNISANSGYKHPSFGPWIATILVFCIYLIHLITRYNLAWKLLQKYAKCASVILPFLWNLITLWPEFGV